MFIKKIGKMPFFLAYTFYFFFTGTSVSQGFEGKIMFKKETDYETSYIVYSIKNNKIRIDELDKSKKLVRYMLINTLNNQAYLVNPVQKMYKPYFSMENVRYTSKDFEIIQTENTKKIQNYQCRQWRIRNRVSNTEVTYWVAQDNFYFFENMLKVLGHSDNFSAYFLQIPNIKGIMPMEYVDRSLLRVKRVSIIAVELETRTLNEELFRIPENYSSLEESY